MSSMKRGQKLAATVVTRLTDTLTSNLQIISISRVQKNNRPIKTPRRCNFYHSQDSLNAIPFDNGKVSKRIIEEKVLLLTFRVATFTYLKRKQRKQIKSYS